MSPPRLEKHTIPRLIYHILKQMLYQGITISGDDKIETLAVKEVNTSRLAKKQPPSLKKKTPNPSAQYLRIQWTKTAPRRRKKQNSNYIGPHEKTTLRFDFGPRKVPQPENMHLHFHAFS